MATGLAFEGSDLDLAIFGIHINSREMLSECIYKFSKELQSLPFVNLCESIATARVPVIKLVFYAHGYSFSKLN